MRVLHWFLACIIVLLIIGKSNDSAHNLIKQSSNIDATVATTSQTTQVTHTSVEATSTPAKLTFDVLGKWMFVEGKTPIPDSIKKWDGKNVELSGFMMPINDIENIKQFILVQALWGCCYGQPPEVNQVVIVQMQSGKTVDLLSDAVRVTGKFSVAETREEGYLVSLYQLEADKVEIR